MADDQASPAKTATAEVRISIRRDIIPPRFTGAPYRTTISESQRLDSVFYNVRGRDDDRQVRYSFFVNYCKDIY